jgi:hypothetical protein
MRGQDIFYALFILFIFIVLYVFNVMVVQMANIKDNWPLYRCNPSVMPFAGYFGVNSSDNFTYCIQNMQSSFMGYLLEPVQYTLSLISNLGGGISDSVNDIRIVLSSIRTFISNLVQNIFGVFLNILIELQKIIISIKDVVGKTMGIVTTLLYTIEGTMYTMESAWGSPAGDVMRSLCFHPNTNVQLIDHTIIHIKDLSLGDALINGSIVCATMQIKNVFGDKVNGFGKQIEDLYLMGDIQVTGSHLVMYDNNWINVMNHPDAILITNSNVPWLSCIITSNHLIPIGKYIFHDWEDDDDGKPSKYIWEEV